MRHDPTGKKTGATRNRHVARRPRKQPKIKVPAPRIVAKKAPKHERSKDRESKKRLAEALEREAAISEVLDVMSGSPGDVQPVLEAVAKRAAHLCDAPYANVLIRDGDVLRPSAFSRLPRGKSVLPIPLTRGSANGRAVLDRTTLHHADIVPFIDSEFPDARQNTERLGVRAHLAVPLLRKGEAYGTIVVFRREPRAFSPEQIALVETFARQAVIAIENVQLFNQTKEALERQTATSEVLRVISSSPTDVQPVFETIVASAARLCSAESAAVYRFDGEVADFVAGYNFSPEALEAYRRYFPCPLRETDHLQRLVDGSVLNIPDIESDPHTTMRTGNMYRARGVRSTIFVPMLREGRAIGAIGVSHRDVDAFSADRVELLKTFADQAVIAIENVRLFDEVQARTRELSESLQQQTGTADVLKVISRSTFDLQTVLDTLTESACKLCEAETSGIYRPDGEVFKLAAMFGQSPEVKTALKQHAIRPGRDTCVGRALLERGTVHIPDTDLDPEYKTPTVLHNVRGNRAMLGVPILRERSPIGVFILTRPIARPFTEKQIALATTFADQAGIAIENVRLFNETKEALQRQTATSEILSVISQSPTDVQPVFDTIAAAAMKLCGANRTHVFISDGKLLHIGAFASTSPGPDDEMRQLFPRRLGNDLTASRAILTGGVVVIQDVLNDPEYALKELAPAGGFRSVLAVPLLREGSPIGAIAVSRPEPGPFPDNQIALLQTFAAQAVIAIENVRLFNETKDALERQTATSDILRVISQSPRDVQPVFDTIVAAALRLCNAASANLFTFDGHLVHLAAYARPDSDSEYAGELLDLRRNFPRPPGRDLAASRAILTGSVVSIPDVLADDEYGFKETAVAGGFRSNLAVPLIRDGRPIGAIVVGRPEPGPFPDKQLALLQTFADQAVIAIENVRLLTELEGRNRDLTATSEILRVISISPTNVQPVFDAIIKNAVQLCEARYGAVFRLDRGLVHLAAHHNISETLVAQWFHTYYPMAPNRGHVSGRAILAGAAVQVPDILADKEYLGAGLKAAGFRSLLGVPLLHRGQAIGAILIYRTEPGQFANKHVELLKTFADQAVIAIENVRLFTELEARTMQLTKSVGELKALGEVGHAVSSTLDLETVLSTIVSRAVQLAGMDGGSIWEYDEEREEFHVRATDRLPHELVEAHRATPIRKGEGALGRLAMTREPVEIHDIALEAGYPTHLREILIRSGYRSVLAVPLLREDHLLGALAVNRSGPGEFDAEVVALLKTFATQSALAIQNARLYREIEDKSRELEAASRHKSEFLANMSHELRTPLNAIIGFSEVLSERMFGEINEKQAEYIGDILQSGQHLLSLINDILDLSKIEAGRMELELGNFDLPSVIESTLTLVRERAVRRGITLGRVIDERLGAICADERKVKQVLLNLLSNALKFTPEGGKIDVRAAVLDGAAEISVADTGVGIAPEDQETVFEEFRQVGTAYKKVEGTGLGLAISRKFIELHGGRIWVKSTVGIGSTFSFTLPLQ